MFGVTEVPEVRVGWSAAFTYQCSPVGLLFQHRVDLLLEPIFVMRNVRIAGGLMTRKTMEQD